MSSELSVTLHDRLVATITNIPGDTNVVAIDRDFANDPNAPTLSFKAFRDPATRGYRTTIRPTQTVVHPFFANLLPEGPLRTYIARHARVKGVRNFPLLELLGNDLPGALIMRSADPRPSSTASDIEPEREHDDERSRIFRFSLAGVQLKFSASGDPARGLMIPAAGQGGSWILKLPDQRFAGVPENEFAMMTFAREVGIDVPEIGLVPAGAIAGLPDDVQFSGNAYYARRFDRGASGERTHMEDFAQANMLYPAEKYDRFTFDMLVTQAADVMGGDVAMEVLRRIVFAIGIGNGDMHAKNWTVLYPDGRTPTLAPAYDYVSTIAYLPNEDLGMNLAGTKRFAEIDGERISRLASHARLSTAAAGRAVRAMVARMRDVWPSIAESLPIDDTLRSTIASHMDAVPLFRGK